MEFAQMVSPKHSQQQFYGSGYYFSIFFVFGVCASVYKYLLQFCYGPEDWIGKAGGPVS